MEKELFEFMETHKILLTAQKGIRLFWHPAMPEYSIDVHYSIERHSHILRECNKLVDAISVFEKTIKELPRQPY
jgi:hypothetical protein